MKKWKDWKIEEFEDKKRFDKKIYHRGVWDEELFKKTITIVGSRKITKYGVDVIKKLIPELVAQKITVISGFMYGVDTYCHRETLECGGNTIAVVGGGLNEIANYYNEELYTAILENGGIIMSEYPPDFKPTTWSFPQRDRLMAQLATVGVLVIEGGIKSGSLITAKHAQKLDKKLLAIPGPINSLVSEGTNWLIKTGAAKMVTEIGDILPQLLDEQQNLFKDYSKLKPLEAKIIQILENEAVTADEICHKLHESVIEVSKTISSLAMRDLVEEVGGKIYLS